MMQDESESTEVRVCQIANPDDLGYKAEVVEVDGGDVWILVSVLFEKGEPLRLAFRDIAGIKTFCSNITNTLDSYFINSD